MGEIKKLPVNRYKFQSEAAISSAYTENLLRTLAESSKQLLKAFTWQPLAGKILANIGKAVDVSQVCIFTAEHPVQENMHAHIEHEWSANLTDPHYNCIDAPSAHHKLISLECWKTRLQAREIIYGNARQFEKPDQKLLESQNVKSFVLLPIHVSGKWWGCICFNEHRWERNWSANTLLLLKLIADMFAAAIEGETARQIPSDFALRSTTKDTEINWLHADAELMLLWINTSCCKILGFMEKELHGKTLTDIIHPDDRKHCQVLLSSLPHAPTLETEIRLLHKNLTPIWAHMTVNIITHKDHTHSFFNITFTQTTTIQPSNKSSSDSIPKDAYELLVNTADDIIWCIDANLRWTFINPASKKILGYTPEELIGTPCTAIFSAGNPLGFEQIVKNIHTAGQARYQIEALNKTHQPVTLCCNAIAIPGKDSIMGIARDITEYKRAEQILQANEERFQIISKATSDIIWDWNILNGFLWSNLPTHPLFNYKESDIESNFTWWKNHIHPADQKRVINKIHELLESRQNFWCSEYQFQYANGEYANVLDRGYVIYDELHQPIRMIGTLQDISAQKRNEHYLRQSREHLRNLASRELSIREEERQKLSRELHDEFAQILTALKMDLNWLKTKLPQDMELLHERTLAMQGIIDVTMQRVREIAADLRPALLDELGLSAAIEWQVKQFCDRTGCHQSLHIDIDNNKLHQDLQITIFRIFQEALTNIGRHAQASAIEIRLVEDNNDLLLEIKDNGIGFSTKKLHDINSIGLIGMHERAGAFGGHIHILTQPESGTCIFLKIPFNGWQVFSKAIKKGAEAPLV